jgi:hypothetical protein
MQVSPGKVGLAEFDGDPLQHRTVSSRSALIARRVDNRLEMVGAGNLNAHRSVQRGGTCSKPHEAASAAGAAIHDVFAKGGVARLPIFAVEGTVRCFPPLVDPIGGPVVLVGGLDVPMIPSPGCPFRSPCQGGRRDGRDQDKGNKTSAHCGSPCRTRDKEKWSATPQS